MAIMLEEFLFFFLFEICIRYLRVKMPEIFFKIALLPQIKGHYVLGLGTDKLRREACSWHLLKRDDLKGREEVESSVKRQPDHPGVNIRPRPFVQSWVPLSPCPPTPLL